ncbi:kinesin-like protein KIF6 [Styela clava]|uniref:kinesin-like protein KIF6 n=1 Tax=Styela clava TaxID=7725 RepID=UPI001939F509|nr:kinesin-like protein KIF6 [Styela clava]
MVKQTIKIFCRVKPTRSRTGIFSIDDDETLPKSSIEFVIPRDQLEGFVNNKRENYKFAFEKIFDQQAKQDDVFEHVAKDVADNVLAGYNGTIFAYGQTGSGKTFTITGGAEKFADRGIIPRSLSYLFEKFEQDKNHIYSTEVSYLEIYNENGYDLLDPRHEAAKLEDLPKVALMEDPDQNIHLKNLSMLPAQNIEDALNLLFLGDTNRMIAETPMNQASTRSHCIFTIHITSREPGSATIRRSKLHLVDLAGSERVAKTNVGGQLLTEVKYINLSLHFLEQVIISLSEKNRQHIPYRNSMMTSVLRDSLGGNCMTTMIATVSVDKKNVDESISTCRFAQRVALIKNEATLNEELDPKLMILRLKKEIQSLKDELALTTGEQRSDQLTTEEIQYLDELIASYLNDTDLEATLDVGGDMRKIQYSYGRLKKYANRKGVSAIEENGDENVRPDTQSQHQSNNDEQELSPLEIKRLKEILQQRDTEINILVNMLKKERKKVLDAQAQNIPRSNTNSELQTSSGYNSSTYESDQKDSEKELINSKSHVKEPNMSAGRQEAFEIFKQNYSQNDAIMDQKERLKQRYGEAKILGMEVNNARNAINHLKADLEQRKKKRAIQMTMSSNIDDKDDSFEENEREALVRQQIEEAKLKYKNSFMKLKAMKAEIDHLHHLLDRTRVQIQRDFDVWWDQQTKRPPSGRSRPSSSSHHRLNRIEQPQNPIKTTEAWRTPPESPQRFEQNFNNRSLSNTSLSPLQRVSPIGDVGLPGYAKPSPPIGFNLPMPDSVSRQSTNQSLNNSSLSLKSQRSGFNMTQRHLKESQIPTTGDSNTDANILAFIKARESLMQKKNGQYS